jgi:hypothetical protein
LRGWVNEDNEGASLWVHVGLANGVVGWFNTLSLIAALKAIVMVVLLVDTAPTTRGGDIVCA